MHVGLYFYALLVYSCYFTVRVLYLHVVHIIQVKVLLMIGQKLMVMISLSIHMMTSPDRICVQYVKNGLQQKDN